MCTEKQVDMSKGRDKPHPASPGNVSCSICLEVVEKAGDRSVARLKCSHYFHLDCIGSAFNAKGAMQCPNCRQVEAGQWLFAGGCFLQQHHLLTSANLDEESNNYGGNMAYRHDNERHYAHMSRRPHGGAHHHAPVFHEDNAYRLAASRWGTEASHEATPRNLPIDDISRPDTLDMSLSYGAGMYPTTMRPRMPRVHGWAPHGSRILDAPDVLESPIMRERSDENGMLFSYEAPTALTSGHRYGPNRGASDTAWDLHLWPQTSLSNLEQQHRVETGGHNARYGLLDGIPYNARRVAPYPSHTGLGYDLRREVHPYDPSRPFPLTYNGSIPSFDRAMDSHAYGGHQVGSRNLWL